MSRVGNKVIAIPEKVKVDVQGQKCAVTGPLGALSLILEPQLELQMDQGKLVLKRRESSQSLHARHGLARSLVANMVQGVSQGFKKELEINGVGYRAEVQGKDLVLSLGFSHQIRYPIPEGIKISVEKQIRLTITGISKALVGEVTAQIRKLKKPEPYKGKGIKYIDELIIRKVGKAAAGAGAGGGK